MVEAESDALARRYAKALAAIVHRALGQASGPGGGT
jgi:hypothetical protein